MSTHVTIEQRNAWQSYIRGLRRRLSLAKKEEITQEQVASAVGITQYTLSTIERGPFENEKFFDIARLLNYYREGLGDNDITLNDLAGLVGLYYPPIRPYTSETAEMSDILREFSRLPEDTRKLLIPIIRSIIHGSGPGGL